MLHPTLQIKKGVEGTKIGQQCNSDAECDEFTFCAGEEYGTIKRCRWIPEKYETGYAASTEDVECKPPTTDSTPGKSCSRCFNDVKKFKSLKCIPDGNECIEDPLSHPERPNRCCSGICSEGLCKMFTSSGGSQGYKTDLCDKAIGKSSCKAGLHCFERDNRRYITNDEAKDPIFCYDSCASFGDHCDNIQGPICCDKNIQCIGGKCQENDGSAVDSEHKPKNDIPEREIKSDGYYKVPPEDDRETIDEDPKGKIDDIPQVDPKEKKDIKVIPKNKIKYKPNPKNSKEQKQCLKMNDECKIEKEGTNGVGQVDNCCSHLKCFPFSNKRGDPVVFKCLSVDFCMDEEVNFGCRSVEDCCVLDGICKNKECLDEDYDADGETPVVIEKGKGNVNDLCNTDSDCNEKEGLECRFRRKDKTQSGGDHICAPKCSSPHFKPDSLLGLDCQNHSECCDGLKCMFDETGGENALFITDAKTKTLSLISGYTCQKETERKCIAPGLKCDMEQETNNYSIVGNKRECCSIPKSQEICKDPIFSEKNKDKIHYQDECEQLISVMDQQKRKYEIKCFAIDRPVRDTFCNFEPQCAKHQEICSEHIPCCSEDDFCEKANGSDVSRCVDRTLKINSPCDPKSEERKCPMTDRKRSICYSETEKDHKCTTCNSGAGNCVLNRICCDTKLYCLPIDSNIKGVVNQCQADRCFSKGEIIPPKYFALKALIKQDPKCCPHPDTFKKLYLHEDKCLECTLLGGECQVNGNECCDGHFCKVRENGKGFECTKNKDQCIIEGNSCEKYKNECCPGIECLYDPDFIKSNPGDTPNLKCLPIKTHCMKSPFSPCNSLNKCCSNEKNHELFCDDGICHNCKKENENCQKNGEIKCCGDMICFKGKCKQKGKCYDDGDCGKDTDDESGEEIKCCDICFKGKCRKCFEIGKDCTNGEKECCEGKCHFTYDGLTKRCTLHPPKEICIKEDNHCDEAIKEGHVCCNNGSCKGNRCKTCQLFNEECDDADKKCCEGICLLKADKKRVCGKMPECFTPDLNCDQFNDNPDNYIGCCDTMFCNNGICKACTRVDNPCQSQKECCPDSYCKHDGISLTSKSCMIAQKCVEVGSYCNLEGEKPECCFQGESARCNSEKKCEACTGNNKSCDDSTPCCDSLSECRWDEFGEKKVCRSSNSRKCSKKFCDPNFEFLKKKGKEKEYRPCCDNNVCLPKGNDYQCFNCINDKSKPCVPSENLESQLGLACCSQRCAYLGLFDPQGTLLPEKFRCLSDNECIKKEGVQCSKNFECCNNLLCDNGKCIKCGQVDEECSATNPCCKGKTCCNHPTENRKICKEISGSNPEDHQDCKFVEKLCTEKNRLCKNSSCYIKANEEFGSCLKTCNLNEGHCNSGARKGQETSRKKLITELMGITKDAAEKSALQEKSQNLVLTSHDTCCSGVCLNSKNGGRKCGENTCKPIGEKCEYFHAVEMEKHFDINTLKVGKKVVFQDLPEDKSKIIGLRYPTCCNGNTCYNGKCVDKCLQPGATCGIKEKAGLECCAGKELCGWDPEGQVLKCLDTNEGNCLKEGKTCSQVPDEQKHLYNSPIPSKVCCSNLNCNSNGKCEDCILGDEVPCEVGKKPCCHGTCQRSKSGDFQCLLKGPDCIENDKPCDEKGTSCCSDDSGPFVCDKVQKKCRKCTEISIEGKLQNPCGNSVMCCHGGICTHDSLIPNRYCFEKPNCRILSAECNEEIFEGRASMKCCEGFVCYKKSDEIGNGKCMNKCLIDNEQCKLHTECCSGNCIFNSDGERVCGYTPTCINTNKPCVEGLKDRGYKGCCHERGDHICKNNVCTKCTREYDREEDPSKCCSESLGWIGTGEYTLCNIKLTCISTNGNCKENTESPFSKLFPKKNCCGGFTCYNGICANSKCIEDYAKINDGEECCSKETFLDDELNPICFPSGENKCFKIDKTCGIVENGQELKKGNCCDGNNCIKESDDSEKLVCKSCTANDSKCNEEKDCCSGICGWEETGTEIVCLRSKTCIQEGYNCGKSDETISFPKFCCENHVCYRDKCKKCQLQDFEKCSKNEECCSSRCEWTFNGERKCIPKEDTVNKNCVNQEMKTCRKFSQRNQESEADKFDCCHDEGWNCVDGVCKFCSIPAKPCNLNRDCCSQKCGWDSEGDKLICLSKSALGCMSLGKKCDTDITNPGTDLDTYLPRTCCEGVCNNGICQNCVLNNEECNLDSDCCSSICTPDSNGVKRCQNHNNKCQKENEACFSKTEKPENKNFFSEELSCCAPETFCNLKTKVCEKSEIKIKCKKDGEDCEVGNCCQDLGCHYDEKGLEKKCKRNPPKCSTWQCYPGLFDCCNNNLCMKGMCQECKKLTESCCGDIECCDDTVCKKGKCALKCEESGTKCNRNEDCCSNFCHGQLKVCLKENCEDLNLDLLKKIVDGNIPTGGNEVVKNEVKLNKKNILYMYKNQRFKKLRILDDEGQTAFNSTDVSQTDCQTSADCHVNSTCVKLRHRYVCMEDETLKYLKSLERKMALKKLYKSV